ncbi:MAG: matrixin family metalloprotease [Cyanobacteria bacterium]|nr:matrixin family metalloprotease [Cyanobacteriota bacterium]
MKRNKSGALISRKTIPAGGRLGASSTLLQGSAISGMVLVLSIGPCWAGESTLLAVNKPVKKTTAKKTAPPGPWNSDLSKMMDGIESEVKGEDGMPKIPMSPDLQPPPEPSLPAHPLQANPAQQASESDTNSGVDPKTLELIRSKVGDNYLASIKQSGLTKWPASRMPLKIYIEQKSTVPGFSPTFPGILKKAFEDWQSASEKLVTIQFVNSIPGASIVCTWTNKKEEMLTVNEGGNAYVVPDADGIMSADLKILTLIPEQGNKDFYMRHVALHEAGHTLGITGHSDNSNDIMFGTITSADKQADLTSRDKDTLLALYTTSATELAQSKIDTSKEIASTSKSPKIQAFQLNNEAARDIQEQKFDQAIKKLETAHKLDPTNRFVQANLGAMYANLGTVSGMSMNVPQALQYYKKAIPLLEGGGNRTALIQVLENYSKLLRALNQTAELKAIEQKLAKLKGG